MLMLRVLIAGDADDMRNRMVAVLSRTYEVVGIVTTAELFQVASSIRPDVIVCDISTLRIHGLAASKKLIAQRTLYPFVFVSGGTSEEAINIRWKERSFGLKSDDEVTKHLVNAVEAVHNLAVGGSPVDPYFSDQHLEDLRIVCVEAKTLRKAELMIESCGNCNPEVGLSFCEVLDRLTGADATVSEYILEKPASCPRCSNPITEETFVQTTDAW